MFNPLTDIDPYSPTGQNLIWFYYQLKGETPPEGALINSDQSSSFWDKVPGADTVKGFSDSVDKFNSNTSQFFTNMNTFCEYVTHPKMIWDLLYSNGYYITAIVCSICLIMWLMGWKKGIKYASWSVTIYILSMFFNIFFNYL